MGIKIGPIETRNRVFLAPMSGVTDEPFRLTAHEHGAGLVVSEMVAGVLLTGWLVVQMAMIREVNGLHAVMGALGLAERAGGVAG